MQSNLQKQNRGFTLVETLVAITILLLVIIGPITAAQKGIKNAYYASEQLTAVFLAQEAIEGVREMRDRQALDVYYDMDHNSATANTADWIQPLSLSGCLNSTNGCAFDVESNSFSACGSGNNYCQLFIDENTKKYNHDTGIESPFTRKIVVGTAVNSGWLITVTVSWNSQIFGSRNVVLQTWVYDHYQRYEN